MTILRHLLKPLYTQSRLPKRTLCDKHVSKHADLHPDVECAINRQILAELNACYAYLSMAVYFGRMNIALPGSETYFLRMHREEHEHALMFINYQNMRGGKVELNTIACPKNAEWTVKSAFEVSIEMEKLIKEKLSLLHCTAEKVGDLCAMNMLTSEFLDDQDRSIFELGRLLARLHLLSDDKKGEYLFDRHLFKSYKESAHKASGPLYNSLEYRKTYS